MKQQSARLFPPHHSKTLLAVAIIACAGGTPGAYEPPGKLQSEFCFTEAPFPSCHASTIVETAPGALLVAYFGGTDEGRPDVAVWLSRGNTQSDGSTAWSAPELVHRENGVPCWNPVLFKAHSGELLLFFKAGLSPREWSGFLKRSSDDGKTWSAAELLPAGILGPIRSKPIQLVDGRILCGSSVESYKAWGAWIEITPDAGRTWTRHGPINVPGKPYGIIQPAVFLTSDGGLAFLARSRGIGRIVRAESKDGGTLWTAAEPTALPNPNAGVETLRLRDGRLLVLYNHTTVGRSPLNIAVSTDDGRSFRQSLVLEDQPGEYSYPAMIQTADGTIHCTYTWKRQRIKHVAFPPQLVSERATP